MTPELNQFLDLFLWFPLTAILFFAYLIARFFERFSSERTYAIGFFVPIVLYGAASVRYASIDTLSNDPPADTLLGIGGFMILFLSLRLYWLMIVKRRQES